MVVVMGVFMVMLINTGSERKKNHNEQWMDGWIHILIQTCSCSEKP